LTREHLIPALGTKTLAKLGPQDVREFMKAKMDARLSAKTVKYLRDTLRCALNVAVRDGILVRNAAALVKPPRETQRALTVLTQDQARQFLEAARGCRLEALFTVAICMGLREAEALGLRWEDVDFRAGTITVRYQLQRVDGKLQLTQPKLKRVGALSPCLPSPVPLWWRTLPRRGTREKSQAIDGWNRGWSLQPV